MMFVGPIAEWLNEYWYPITRQLWEVGFAYFGLIGISDVLKDYLTAIVFFLPAFLMCRRKVFDKNRGVALFGAFIIAPFMVSILARNLEADLNTIFSSIIIWVIFPLSLVSVSLLIWFNQNFTPGELRKRLHSKTDKPPSRRVLRWARWGVPLVMVISGALVVYDFLLLTISPFPPISATIDDLWLDPVPRRSIIAIFAIIFGIIVPLGSYVDPDKTKSAQRSHAAANAIEKTNTASPRKKAAVLIVLLAIFLVTVVSAILAVGVFETISLCCLVYFVITIVLRTPERILLIAATMAIVLGSSYVVWGIASAKAFLEGMV